jgi:hypothetical protein
MAYIIAEHYRTDNLALLRTSKGVSMAEEEVETQTKWLVDNGYLKDGAVTQLYLDMFLSDSELLFEEFWQAFPVHSPNGRVLRTDKRKSYELYKKAVKGRRFVANEIMAGLKEQLRQTPAQDLKFFKSTPVWLRSQTWKDYLQEAYVQANNPAQPQHGDIFG